MAANAKPVGVLKAGRKPAGNEAAQTHCGASAVKMDALEQLLLRVSEMVCELPQLREMDINPIIIDENGAVAVDARILIDNAPQALSGRSNPYNHLAILPYPARYEQVWPLRGGW